MTDVATIPVEEARALLRRSFAMRAHAYAHMFDVLREEFGAERALDLTMRATRRMGESMGAAFEKHGPRDLAGLKNAFLSGIIEGEALFSPEVLLCDDERLEIQFHRCPLKEAWMEMGRGPEDLEMLCKMAGAIDGGLFTRAGFTFAGDTWKPGQDGCCRLKVLPGPAA
jgi:hypothetical protein